MTSSDKGYVNKLIPYSGKYFKYDKKKGINISLLIEMCRHFVGNRHHKIIYNYYSNAIIYHKR